MTTQTFSTDDAKVTVYLDGPEWDAMPTATLGAFSCKTVEGGQAIIAEALDFARANGKRKVLGPMDGDTWHSYRFVTETDDSPVFLLEPENKPIALEALRAAGFNQISSYFSARVPIEQTATATPRPTDEFAVHAWNGENPEQLFTEAFHLSVEAFSNNAFYKPITREAFLAMYLPMVPMMKPELIFTARRPDETLAGFLFGTPNFAEGPAPESVILKTYASLCKGAGQHLAHHFHTAAKHLGFKIAIHALIHDDNLSALRSASEGADIFRRYGLFGLTLDD